MTVSLDGTPDAQPGGAAELGERRTHVPARDTRRQAAPSATAPPRRDLKTFTVTDLFNVVGAGIAALAVSALLFGRLAPLSGSVGFVVVAYLCFVGFYTLLASFGANRLDVSNRVVTVLLVSAGALLFATLAFIVVYTIARGAPALVHSNFFVETMRLAGPLDPLSVGGIAHAIVGTLIQVSIALLITIPLGVTTAVFLNEVGGPFARFVRTITDAMTALPSIVAGLFIYAAVIQLFTHERNGFAASLAITVMMLPIVIRSADVVLRLVGQNLREASYALGSTRWRTVWHVVLPTARSGLATAVILGTARGIGETSPVLLTSGVTAVMNTNPFSGPMISLPLQVFDFVRSPEPTMVARGFGTAAVLLVLVLALFAVARLIGGQGPGTLSPRRQRVLSDRSRRDLARIDARHAASAAAPVTLDLPEEPLP